MPDDADATIRWDDFATVDLRIGTVTRAAPFPEARTPAHKIWAEVGSEIGTLKSSAQITDRYDLKDLEGRQILGVVNFSSKQIGPFMSEFLVTGGVLDDDAVVLVGPDEQVPNGTRLA